MHVRVSNSACLWVVNQRPYVQGCTELIADPSSVAHLRQNKKHPHQKKPQPTEFLKCSAALCTSKRPSSASNTPQILSQQWALTKGGAEGKETGGEREREMGGTDLCPSLFNIQPFMLELYASCQQHTCVLCSLEWRPTSPPCRWRSDGRHSSVQFYQSWRPDTWSWVWLKSQTSELRLRPCCRATTHLLYLISMHTIAMWFVPHTLDMYFHFLWQSQGYIRMVEQRKKSFLVFILFCYSQYLF